MLATILDDLAQRSASRVLRRVHQQHAEDVPQHLHGAAVTRSLWCRTDCPAGASERTEQHVHLVLSPLEVDILVDALRSVGNVEFAERLETILRQGRQPPAG